MQETISISREWLAKYVKGLAPDATLRVLDSLTDTADQNGIIRAIIAGADFEDGLCPLPGHHNCGATGEGYGWHTGGLASEICVCLCHEDDE